MLEELTSWCVISCNLHPLIIKLTPFLLTKGFGVRQSDSEAEKWWTLAAEQGSDSGSVRAQNTLGLFYAREESLNLDKVSQ